MPTELDISAIADQVADKTALAEANRPRRTSGPKRLLRRFHKQPPR